jgi:hypothetical protein
MKTYFVYGFSTAFATFLLGLVLFLAGMYSDVTKLTLPQLINFVGAVGIYSIGLSLGIKARRATVPADEEFGYGPALVAGLAISCWTALFAAIGQYVYLSVINPTFMDKVLQAKLDRLQEQGVSADRLDKMQSMMHVMSSPPIQLILGFIGSFIFCGIIALIVAACLKRPAEPGDAPASA